MARSLQLKVWSCLGLVLLVAGCASPNEQLVLQGAGVKVTRERAWEIWSRVRQLPYELACFDDVAPTLDALRSQGLTLGLISNINRDSRELTDSLGLTPATDSVLFSGDVDVFLFAAG